MKKKSGTTGTQDGEEDTWVLDVEADGLLDSVTRIWCIVCRNVSDGSVRIFERPDLEPEGFLSFSQNVKRFIWHNGLKYDYPCLTKFGLCGIIDLSNTVDTLVLSRLVYQGRPGGHSLEAWGEKLGIPKGNHKDFSQYSPEMLEYCIQDTLITLTIYNYLKRFLKDFLVSFEVEQFIEWELYNEINQNGFMIDLPKLYSLHSSLSQQVLSLTETLREVIPPRAKFIREITPKLTQHGTLHGSDFRWLVDGDLTPYSAGASFSRIEWDIFNPGSPQQVVRVLNEAGWNPVNKTDGHKDEEKATPKTAEERKVHQERLEYFRVYGWSIDEENLATVPSDAPEEVRTLVRWRMLQSRVSKMEEWIKSLRGLDTIHPTITHIGTVTHRCAHTDPNVGNIPSTAPKYDPNGPIYPEASELGKQLRSMWIARPNRILVGTDADSIQLRVLAHYMDDVAFTQAIVSGRKEDGTDPHSLNKKALGPVCNTRDVAKTFIYAWLLGAGVGKVSQILSCSRDEAKRAIDSFIAAYPGLLRLKNEIIPHDARQGWYRGFDGRKVVPKGRDYDEKVYYMLSGYLQNGESCIMKHATRLWMTEARADQIPFWWINFVHDEWQTETEDEAQYPLVRHPKGHWVSDPGSVGYRLGTIQQQSITKVGTEFGLVCPLAGQSKFGYNWLDTH